MFTWNSEWSNGLQLYLILYLIHLSPTSPNLSSRTYFIQTCLSLLRSSSSRTCLQQTEIIIKKLNNTKIDAWFSVYLWILEILVLVARKAAESMNWIVARKHQNWTLQKNGFSEAYKEICWCLCETKSAL